MLKNLASQIAETTSSVIGYEVLVTDKNSIVIGASDTSRIGTFHEGSKKVLSTKKPLNHYPGYAKNLKGTKPGWTVPIIINNDVVGTIGITGEYEVVNKYGLLAQKYAEIILKEEIYQRSASLSQEAIQNFIQEILVFDDKTNDESMMLTRGHELGYDLKPPHIAIVIDICHFQEITESIYKNKTKNESAEINIQLLKHSIQSIIKSIFDGANDVCAPMGNDKFIVLNALTYKYDDSKVIENIKEKCNTIIQKLEDKNIAAVIGISTICDNISSLSRIYKEAWNILSIGKRLNKSGAFYIKEYFLETLLYNSPTNIKYLANSSMLDLKKQADCQELFKTIRAWYDSGFNQRKTSEMLYIHRNTLNYRIEKIQKICGVNLFNPREALDIYITIIMMELDLVK